MYRIIAISLISAIALQTKASTLSFSEVFADSTLRIDYILSSDGQNTSISLKNRVKSPGWYGRTANLDSLKYAANEDVTVTTLEGDTIYRASYSSLFNEWLDLKEPVSTAFEASVLVPMPKAPVMVTSNVYDKHHNVIASVTHKVDPSDILIKQRSCAPNKYEYLHKGQYPGHKISVAILAEGYRADEMDVFLTDAGATVDAILSHEPFKEMADRFDFIAVMNPSNESGVSVPKDGLWKDTAFKSHYSTFYSDRYLTTSNVFDIHDALYAIPYEHIIILANSDEYGGGGIYNDFTLSTAHHPKFRPVVVHEFGHSFGGLADEYFYVGDVMDDTYPTDTEPWEPNITTLVDFGSKWRDMLPVGTPIPTPTERAEEFPVGVYEGGGYSTHGIYRPADYCRMRVNEVDAFCPVCQRAIRDLIIYYTE